MQVQIIVSLIVSMMQEMRGQRDATTLTPRSQGGNGERQPVNNSCGLKRAMHCFYMS